MTTIVIDGLALDRDLLQPLGLSPNEQAQLVHDICVRLKGHHATGFANREGSIRYYVPVLSGNRIWRLSLDIDAEGLGLILAIS